MDIRSEMFIAESALEAALAVTGQRLGNVQFIDWKLGHLEIVAQRGFSGDFLDCFRRVRSSDGCACGRALLLRDSVVVEDVAHDPRFPGLRGVGETAGFVSVQSTPLISSSGALLGIISTHGAGPPTRRQLDEIASLARRMANELIRFRGRQLHVR